MNERKVNFALGDAPGDADELAEYTFRKKALFSFLLPGPAAEWYENIYHATIWENVRTKCSLLDFQTDGRNFDTEWKMNIVSDEMEKKFETFYTVSKKRLTKAGPMICVVLRPRNEMQNETLKLDKEDKDTSTSR